MKYLFFVQGEGRGHLTQALALKEKLEARQHSVVAIIIGFSNKKPIPTFFKDSLNNIPLISIDSPSFLVDKKNKGIMILPSALSAIWRLPRYLKSLAIIRQSVIAYQPDIFINFYEAMGANYYRLYREKKPLFCFGHQYFIQHPAFKFPNISWLAKISFKFFNDFTAPRRAVRLALSFTNEIDQPKKNLFICPPLIRAEIKKQTPIKNDFILSYLLNAGYSQEIISWCQKNPNQKIEAFWDKVGPTETSFGNNLTFHYLDGQKFINYLNTCSSYASTAGFDSICEAAYLQKNILMIPTKNHFEQKCNAVDARRAGLAISADNFDISLLLEEQQKTHSREAGLRFKEWVDKYDDKIINILENLPQKT